MAEEKNKDIQDSQPESELKEYETEETKDFDIDESPQETVNFWHTYKTYFTYGLIFLMVLHFLL